MVVSVAEDGQAAEFVRARSDDGHRHIPGRAHSGGGAGGDAGFEFDVPVRFDSDKLEISLQGFRHGAIPSIPIVEVRL